jgi:hypothetical protein
MIRYVTPFCLLLAACGGGQGSTGSNSSSGESEGSAGATQVVEPTDANLQDDPQNGVVPLDAPQPAATAASIPAAFQGRWALVPNDCDEARGDNKGLMTVGADRLRFYESRATPGAIRMAGPGRLQTTLSFVGEGQSWSHPTTLTVQEDGRVLVREEEGSDALRYTKCPGAA